MDKKNLKSAIEALLFVSGEPLSLSEIKTILKDQAVSSNENEEENFIEGEMPTEEIPTEIPLEVSDTELIHLSQIQSHNDDGISEMLNLEENFVEETQDEISSILNQIKKKQTELNQDIAAGDIKEALIELMQEYQSDEKGIEIVEVARGYAFRTKQNYASIVKKIYKLPKPKLSTPGLETLSIIAYQQPVTRARIEEIRGVDSGGVIKTLLEKDLVRLVGKSDDPGRAVLYGTSKKFLEVFSLSSLADLPTLRDLEALEQGEGASRPAINEGAEEPIFRLNDEQDFAREQFEELEAESDELLEELDSSLKNLKGLEKNIFKEETPVTPANAVNPAGVDVEKPQP